MQGRLLYKNSQSPFPLAVFQPPATAESVIVITVVQQFSSESKVVEHRGIRYAIRMGIERGQWRVAVYRLGDGLPEERTVFGTRQDAIITARSMINAWLKKQSVVSTTNPR